MQAVELSPGKWGTTDSYFGRGWSGHLDRFRFTEGETLILDKVIPYTFWGTMECGTAWSFYWRKYYRPEGLLYITNKRFVIRHYYWKDILEWVSIPLAGLGVIGLSNDERWVEFSGIHEVTHTSRRVFFGKAAKQILNDIEAIKILRSEFLKYRVEY